MQEDESNADTIPPEENEMVDSEPPKPASEPPKPASEPAPGGHKVAEGKSVQCRRGRLKSGAEVRENDFDAETLKMLIAKGVIV